MTDDGDWRRAIGGMRIRLAQRAMQIAAVGAMGWFTYQAVKTNYDLMLISVLCTCVTLYLVRQLDRDKAAIDTPLVTGLMVLMGWGTLTYTGVRLGPTTPEMWMFPGVVLWTAWMQGSKEALLSAAACQASLLGVHLTQTEIAIGVLPQQSIVLWMFTFMAIAGRQSLDDQLKLLETGINRIEEQRNWNQKVLNGLAEAVVTMDQDGRVTLSNPSARELLGERATVGSMLLPLILNTTDLGSHPVWRGPVTVDNVNLMASVAPLNVGRDRWTLVARDRAREEELQRLQDDFVTSVNHELRTPLTSVIGALDLLSMDSLPPHRREQLLSLARRNANRLSVLVQDLLDLSRVESVSANSLALAPVLVADVVQASLETVQLQANAAGIHFDVDVGACVVRADFVRLQQIMTNLLMNAVAHGPSGGQIRVLANSLEGHVRILVQDDGPGVPDEHREQIFSRFYQVDSYNQGTGIGLALARSLAELQNGSLSLLDCSPTTFELTLAPAHSTKPPRPLLGTSF